MSDKKFKVFCKITDYVDSVDPDLAELLRGTCADMALNSTKGKPGITFLLPKDKALRKKIADLAYSDSVDDANKACDMLNALIVKLPLLSAADWEKYRSDIPNSLMPSTKVEIKSASGKKVTFANGAVAELDEGFKSSSKKPLAVWNLVSGDIPNSGKEATMEHLKKSKMAKKGGYEPEPALSSKLRFQIALAVENAYLYHHLAKQAGPGVPARNVYHEYVLSLLGFLHKNDPELLFNRILPLYAGQNIDFYLMLEPHSLQSDYLIPDNLLAAWWSQHNAAGAGNLLAIREQVDKWLDSAHGGAKIYTEKGRLEIATAADKIRKQLGQSANPRLLADKIAESYKSLSESNRLAGVDGVFPSDLAAKYAARPLLKLMQDELRYISDAKFESLERSFDHAAYQDVLELIGEYMHSEGKDAHDLKLMNPFALKYLIAPQERVQDILGFVFSTCFLEIPLHSGAAYPIKDSVRKPEPGALSAVYNVHKKEAFKHKRLALPGPGDSAPLIAALEALAKDPAKADPKLREALQKAAANLA